MAAVLPMREYTGTEPLKKISKTVAVDSNGQKYSCLLYTSSTFFRKINQSSTEKQALAASLILTADFLINEYIFKDGQCISFEEMQQFLSDKDSVCQELSLIHI